MRLLKPVLRGAGLLVTAGSIFFMFAPDRFRGPMLALGLGGQFLLGTVVLVALAAEVFWRGMGPGA